MTKFIATFDLHYGYERTNGHKKAIHDSRAWQAVLKFAQTFKPDVWVCGGDMLDCGAVSHHSKGKPGQIEGLRLLADAQEVKAAVIAPVEALAKTRIYLIGNHEAWLEQLVDEMPALEGIIDIKHLLGLKGWAVVPQGQVYNLGKLTFLHGDTVSGGEHVAKAAVTTYERSVRFGHFHTYQAYAKVSPLDYKFGKTGIAVPCLCTKQPKYSKNKPNKWQQGFLCGYVRENGTFHDYVVTIIDGGFTGPDGKRYEG